MADGEAPLLAVDDLSIDFGDGPVVDHVSLTVQPGDRVGIIGESGSGKTLTALAIIGLAPDNALITGSIRWNGQELLGRSDRDLSELRGDDISDETSVSLNLGADVAISEDYISDMGQRLRTYKRVASARDDETLRQIRAETEDRYGRPPASVENLFAYSRLRRVAEELGVISIDRTPAGAAI